ARSSASSRSVLLSQPRPRKTLIPSETSCWKRLGHWSHCISGKNGEPLSRILPPAPTRVTVTGEAFVWSTAVRGPERTKYRVRGSRLVSRTVPPRAGSLQRPSARLAPYTPRVAEASEADVDETETTVSEAVGRAEAPPARTTASSAATTPMRTRAV